MKYVVSLILRATGAEKKTTLNTWDEVLRFIASYDWSRIVITKRNDL